MPKMDFRAPAEIEVEKNHINVYNKKATVKEKSDT